MNDLDTLRPEVQTALNRIGIYVDGKLLGDNLNIIRAELLRLADENARLRERVSDTEHFRDVHLRAAGIFRQRAEKAEAELAALKARIAGSCRAEGQRVFDLLCLPIEYSGTLALVKVEE